ncbi:esterase/lipase family protein [Rhodococcus tukisamuensis]|uniref:Lipase (Class 2) n=1 Tax=Rhodococcus tukisamuensis TaxID=168276 RepID=A0A1G7E2U8_9NOCA|nr:alpha/beta fold hydrolase [Rhodococcus tukisamuensis]SDE57952.1 Lipase (class 2) [Rhodococcus tukisamuensis]
MTTRLRAATTSLATIALLTLGATLMPTATASAQLGSSGSAGGATDPNDYKCKSTQHERPVVLVHGTNMDWQGTWPVLKTALEGDNYCTFVFNYGGRTVIDKDGKLATEWGTGPIEDSAKELNTFIEKVRSETKSAQVDVVGHSQGGTMTRQYLRFLGGAERHTVHTLAMLAPSTHGSDLDGKFPNEAATKAAGLPVAFQQQTVGSSFLTALNADNKETFPGIEYTVIASNTDKIITPTPPKVPTNPAFLIPAPGTEGSVHNITVQDACNDPGLEISHAGESTAGDPTGMLNHPAPLFLVRKALDPTLAGPVPC